MAHLRRMLPGLLLLLVVAMSGCGYGKVSPATYELAQALINVCSQERTDKLADVEALIESKLAAEELSEQEAQWLTDIVEEARAENWDSAEQMARNIMSDQVEY